MYSSTVDASLTAALVTGFLLGIRHALDPDHLVAVAAFVSEERSVGRSCLLGTFWGAGHTAALLVAGVATIGLRLSISASVQRGFEAAVAVVLVLLGGHVLRRALRTVRLHRHQHVHDGRLHSHVHLHVGGEHDHRHRHALALGRRPFLMGLLHGMAGSAALMLLVLSTIPSPLLGFLYILVFGVGATGAMLVLSGLLGIPFAVTAGRARTLQVALQAAAGGLSLVLGLVMSWGLTTG